MKSIPIGRLPGRPGAGIILLASLLCGAFAACGDGQPNSTTEAGAAGSTGGNAGSSGNAGNAGTGGTGVGTSSGGGGSGSGNDAKAVRDFIDQQVGGLAKLK